jgi:hypothetical protein
VGRTWPSSSMRAWYRRSSCSACANFERSAPASCGERTRHLRAPPCCLRAAEYSEQYPVVY